MFSKLRTLVRCWQRTLSQKQGAIRANEAAANKKRPKQSKQKGGEGKQKTNHERYEKKCLKQKSDYLLGKRECGRIVGRLWAHGRNTLVCEEEIEPVGFQPVALLLLLLLCSFLFLFVEKEHAASIP